MVYSFTDTVYIRLQFSQETTWIAMTTIFSQEVLVPSFSITKRKTYLNSLSIEYKLHLESLILA